MSIVPLHHIAVYGKSTKERFYLRAPQPLFYDGSSMSGLPASLSHERSWLTETAIIVNDQLYFEGGLHTFEDGNVASLGMSNAIR